MRTVERQLPTAIIVGPPWPRSGTARVVQNQVDYYRNRGFATILITVAIDCFYVPEFPEWGEIQRGMEEIGADWTFVAPINKRLFLRGKYLGWLKRFGRPTELDWIVFTAESAELSESATEAIRSAEVEVIQVNHVFTLGFAQRLRRRILPRRKNVPLLLDTHDVQAHLLKERGETNQWTHRADTLENLLRSEYEKLKKPDVLVHCSVEDFNFFKAHIPDRRHVLVLPSIDEAFTSLACSASSGEPIDLLFVGQSTGPNLVGIRWFLEEVWPLLAERRYSISIVGKIETLVREQLPDLYERFKGLFVGPVAELEPYYAAARCVIAPMISGTGISIKTVEALALGKPFVGTAKAYRGMPADRLADYGLRAHDTPQAFASAISEALSDGAQSAAASRRAYQELFSRSASFFARDKAFQIATAAMNPIGSNGNWKV
jgi:glycosyltransferase involved in cell wall biosynthesis